ncbi:hypothetical protein ACQKWADRAFT_84052 [Trichoderma austrokoningii]
MDALETVSDMEARQPGDTKGEQELHICIHPQCGACGQLFLPDDHIVALLFSDKKCLIYDACEFSVNGYAQQSEEGNHMFCKKPRCDLCLGAKESITMHTDCFHMCYEALKNDGRDLNKHDLKEGLRRLWLAATWRYAWRTMAPLKMPGHHTLTNPLPSMIQKICDFRRKFTPEIARLIQSYSSSSVLWRLCCAHQLIEELQSAESDKAVTCSLSKVLHWFRGSSPKFVENEQVLHPFVRLIMDSRGIKSIERIPESSANKAFYIPSHSSVFITELAEKLKTVEVEFQLGMSRLHIPKPSSISIWSAPVHTPNFLALKDIEDNAPYYTFPPLRFAAINLDPQYCTGISFFVKGQSILDIHGHSKNGLPALETFNFLRSTHKCKLLWIYIPMAAQDRISAIGVRRTALGRAPLSITLYLKSGQSVIGIPPKNLPTIEALHTLAEQRHPTLVYNIPYKDAIAIFEVGNTFRVITNRTRADEADEPHLPNACFSSAPLTDVRRAYVFTGDFKLCKGILIEYNSGLKKALGQCRLGLDSVQEYSEPFILSYATTPYVPKCNRFGTLSKSVYLSFDPQRHLYYHDKKLVWEHYPMKGQLSFWFTKHEVFLQVSQD